MSELEKDSAAAGEQHGRLRQENLQLVHRANALEEQLKEQEFRAQEKVLEETRKQKELLCKMEREKSIEIENLQARLQQLDEENSELRSCTPCLKANIERLEEEKQKMLDEIEELTQRLSEEQENKRKMGDKLSHEVGNGKHIGSAAPPLLVPLPCMSVTSLSFHLDTRATEFCQAAEALKNKESFKFHLISFRNITLLELL